MIETATPPRLRSYSTEDAARLQLFAYLSIIPCHLSFNDAIASSSMLPRSLTTFAITMMTSICSYSLRSTTQLNSIPVESTKPYTSQKLQIAAGLAAEASKSCHTLSRRHFDLKLLFEPCQHYEHHTECRCWPGETRLDCKSLDRLRNNLAPTQRCYELSPLQDGPCGLCGCS